MQSIKSVATKNKNVSPCEHNCMSEIMKSSYQRNSLTHHYVKMLNWCKNKDENRRCMYMTQISDRSKLFGNMTS